MALSIIQSAKYTPGSTGNTIVLTLGTSPTIGNLLFAVCGYSTYGGVRTIDTPSGWTKLDDQYSGSDGLATFYKIVAAGDGTSYTWNISGSNEWRAGVIMEITGEDTSSPINGHAIANHTTPSTTFTTPNVTPSIIGCLAIAGATEDAGGANSDTVSAGWTIIQSARPSYHATDAANRDSLTSDITTAINNTFTWPSSVGVSTTILINPALAAPTLTTQAASAVTKTTATLNGNITATGGVNPTIRGFQYNTVEYPDKTTIESGDFSTGAFTANITGLTPNTLYYFRSYATNSVGTSYGSWETFTTDPATYNISIGGVDRTTDVLNQTATVEDILNDQQNTCNFALIDRSGNGIPATDDEITITLDDDTILFSGYIQKVDLDKQPNGVILAVCQCIDQVWLLDRNLVHKTYESMTDKAIIEDIISVYCAGFGITTTNVVEGVTISQISFNYIQPSQAIRKICDITGRNWYIDYDKDIHYFPLATNAAPFNIDSTNNDYSNLKISKDNTQLKNRVYVRGGTKLSDATTYSVKGDGVARQFPLPDKPHDTSMTVNAASKTIGIKNIDTSGFDWYLNFQEKYLEQDSGGSVLTSSDTLVLTYTYDIPILVAVENTQSIIDNEVKEFAIFDKSITTTQAARDRASAELTDYAADIIEGSFSTLTSGFRSGQYININLSEYGVNANYLIQKVTAKSFGGGNYEYEISVASAKTMGIIRFLIELLEANKNLIELDDNESVDELLSLTDLLYSDSITEELTIDSAGAYRTWCQDSLEATNTRARWNLFEWGGNS